MYRIETEPVQKILRARIKSAPEGVFQLAPADMKSKANIRDSDGFCQSITHPSLGPSCQVRAVIARQRHAMIGKDGFPGMHGDICHKFQSGAIRKRREIGSNEGGLEKQTSFAELLSKDQKDGLR